MTACIKSDILGWLYWLIIAILQLRDGCYEVLLHKYEKFVKLGVAQQICITYERH